MEVARIFLVLSSVALCVAAPAKYSQQDVHLAIDQIFGKPNVTTAKPPVVPKKILNRSIFEVPTLKPDCLEGYRLNSNNGKCEEVVNIINNDYFSFLLEKIFGYDYDDEEEPDDDQINRRKDGEDDEEEKDSSTRISIPFL